MGLVTSLEDLPASMKNRLESQGVDKLFPVQSSTFNLFVEEGNELIVKSRTGTGKTLSFLLPLEYLIRHGRETKQNNKIEAIILEPTRELAT